MNWDHGKKTDDEVSAFRAQAEQHGTEFLRGLLVDAEACVPEYVQAIREILAGREGNVT